MEKLPLDKLQQQMIAYLIDNKTGIAEHIAEQGGISAEKRLHIYKNAYRMRLIETIDNDHQLLGLYLGDDLFEQMVNGYIDHYPSANTSLRQFADQLPVFLAKFEPFKQYPLISELAHFERMLMVAFDAADCKRFDRSMLQALPHDKWPTLQFRFHPSVQIAHFTFNTVETWQALKQEQVPPQPMKQASSWLLWRNYERLTQFRSLDAQEYSLIDMILKGASFEQICEQLLVTTPEQEVTQVALNYLLHWIDDGLLAQR